jgi:hypothetical protein
VQRMPRDAQRTARIARDVLCAVHEEPCPARMMAASVTGPLQARYQTAEV